MKICKYKSPAGECGELPPVRKGREAYDILCVPEGCDMFTPLTNLDRVRAMDIPALAEILTDGCVEAIPQEHCDRYNRDCAACWADWLAAEAETEET